MNVEQSLPRGWTWTKLGEIRLDLSQGVQPGKSPTQIFELYSIPSFEARKPEIVPGSTIGSNKQSVEAGTVLISKINPRINRAWEVGYHSDYPKIASTEWIPFFKIQEIVPSYLCYYLSTHAVRDFLAANASGVGGSLMRINERTIANYSFPLPPLNEQQRIVSVIEQQFTRIDAGIADLKRIKKNLQRSRVALLRDAVSGKLTEKWREAHPETEPAPVLLQHILAERRAKWEENIRAKGKDPKKERYVEPVAPDIKKLAELPEKWCWATVEQVSDVGTGATPLRSHLDYYKGGIIPWITSGALNSEVITQANEFITEKALKETNTKIFPIGTLLVAMYGEGKTRGKVSELKIEATTNQACAALVFRPLTLDCQPYVKHFLLSNYYEIRRLSVGGVQPNLNLTSVKETCIPFPPLAEQEQIVSEVEQQLSIINKYEAVADELIKYAEWQRQAILQRAFSGRLVKQDPNDEPASVLLERIQQERKKREKKQGTHYVYAREDGERLTVDPDEVVQTELWPSVEKRYVAEH